MTKRHFSSFRLNVLLRSASRSAGSAVINRALQPKLVAKNFTDLLLVFRLCFHKQFDEYIWFHETGAVQPLSTAKLEGLPDTYQFGI